MWGFEARCLRRRLSLSVHFSRSFRRWAFERHPADLLLCWHWQLHRRLKNQPWRQSRRCGLWQSCYTCRGSARAGRPFSGSLNCRFSQNGRLQLLCESVQVFRPNIDWQTSSRRLNAHDKHRRNDFSREHSPCRSVVELDPHLLSHRDIYHDCNLRPKTHPCLTPSIILTIWRQMDMRSVLGDASGKEAMLQDTLEVALLSAVVQLVDRSRQQWLKDLAVNENLANCARMSLAGSDEGWLSG